WGEHHRRRDFPEADVFAARQGTGLAMGEKSRDKKSEKDEEGLSEKSEFHKRLQVIPKSAHGKAY
ncbi:MAG: hypothetical protein LBI02_07165, partial [Opitutaceae bacterium]|nr:hypothetical protein [Opitutaceae bacterium]